MDRYWFRLADRLGTPVHELTQGRPDPVIQLEHLDSRLLTGCAIVLMLAAGTGFAVLWALLMLLAARLVMSARLQVVGAGRKPLPLWEVWHWMGLDSIDHEDAERHRQMQKMKGRRR